MRKLFSTFLALSLSSPAWSVIAYVGGNANSNGSGDPFVSSAYTGTAGNIIALGVFWKGAVTVTSVTCSACGVSCVDSGAGALARPVDGFLQVFYCPNISGGSSTYTVDFSGTPTAGENVILKDEFSGVATASPVETTATGTATSDPVTTGNIVTSNANDVIYAFGIMNNTSTKDATFTDCQANAGGASGNSTEYRLVTPGTYTASFSATMTKGGIIGVALKAPAAGGASTVCPSIIGSNVICGNNH